MKGVYLLHFDRRYQHAGHYLGWAANIAARLELHRAGQGARLVEVVTDAGIGVELVRVWDGASLAVEAQLKRRHAGPRLCPICQGADVDQELVNYAQVDGLTRRRLYLTDDQLLAELPHSSRRACPICHTRRRLVHLGDPGDELPAWLCPRCWRQDLTD